MGTRTDAYLVYGIQLKEGSFSPLGGFNSEPGTPKHLAWSGDAHDGIAIIAHQSSIYPEYIVCAADPIYKAQRGYPLKVDPLHQVENQEVAAKILAYCKEHGLETEGPLGWLLCSYWG